MLRVLPGMTVVCPGDPQETEAAVRALARHRGPAYLRLGRAGEPVVHPGRVEFRIGESLTLREGNDGTLLTTGNMLAPAVRAAELLAERGLRVRVIPMPTVKPLDVATIQRAARETGWIATLEEHSRLGGFGAAVAECLADLGLPVRLRRFGAADHFSHTCGDQAFHREAHGLAPAQIADALHPASDDACRAREDLGGGRLLQGRAGGPDHGRAAQGGASRRPASTQRSSSSTTAARTTPQEVLARARRRATRRSWRSTTPELRLAERLHQRDEAGDRRRGACCSTATCRTRPSSSPSSAPSGARATTSSTAMRDEARDAAPSWSSPTRASTGCSSAMAYIRVPLDAGDFSLIDRRVVDVAERAAGARSLRARACAPGWASSRSACRTCRPERMFGRTTNNMLAQHRAGRGRGSSPSRTSRWS